MRIVKNRNKRSPHRPAALFLSAVFINLIPSVFSQTVTPAASPVAPQASPPGLVYVRKDIATLPLDGPEIAALRKGFSVMRSRPANDPTSLAFQANIHGTYDSAANRTEARAWNQCQHGSFFFLSWHRMYLYYFERILRKASGDPGLALPYWNYSVDTGRALPLAFRQPASAENALFTTERAPGINQGAMLPPSAVNLATTFGYTKFSSRSGSGLSFGGQLAAAAVHFLTPHGQLEKQPHDVIHVLIGGQNGWMADPNFAARDPIFWLHHANIDRLWKRWLDQGGGRRNPTGNTAWMRTVSFRFYDENKHQVAMTGRQVLETAQQLGYRYEDDPPSPTLRPAAALQASEESLTPAQAQEDSSPMPTSSPGSVVAKATTEQGAVRLQGQQVQVPLASTTNEPKRHPLFAPRGQIPGRLVLNLEGLQYDKNPGIYYEIYLNLPVGVEPDPQSPYYVGNLAFFALKPHHPGQRGAEKGVANYDITNNVRALQRLNKWTEKGMKVTFVPRGLIPESTGIAAQAHVVQPAPTPVPAASVGRITITKE